ncbi:hypothetical protein AB835_11250 [Candidatus Endobugula sertula]|uniref:Lipoprotein n=1 Tax=Candidatus Endobugula sertula TaxID=62101 RepID=A0A1D2QN24_9GAMM|nr:hypothetical protein AB835_11250 [Candidatus Endobugula sertula]
MKKNLILLCCVSVLGCHQGDDGLARLKALCEKDAGVTIHRTVEVDGYYDGYTGSAISDKLVTTDYKFFEFCDESPSPLGAVIEPGCWRVKRIERRPNRCDQRIDDMLKKVVLEPYVSFRKTYCIAVEKIEKPEA